MNLAPRELPDDSYAWWREVMLAADCLLNAVLRGWHHETLSSRSWRAWSQGLRIGALRKVIDWLFIWQSWKLDHCERHYKKEVARAALIVKARKP
jgi:hypothetical protein